MRLVIISSKLIGEKLASPIYTENGVMFLGRGGELTESTIKRLIKMGVTTSYIEDNNDEICLQEVIEAPIKLKLIKSIKGLFNDIKSNKFADEQQVTIIIKEIIENINLSENAVMVNNLVPNDEIGELAVHSLDVTIFSIMVGINKRYDLKKLIKLGTSALLHDIGKLFTDSSNHINIAYDLMKKSVHFSTLIYVAIHQLYETMDGKGPLELPGDKITEFAKILSICNEYVNLLNREEGILPHEVIEKISAEAVNKFDMGIYRDFTLSIYCYPNGLPVVLNNGLTGVVAMQNRHATTRPIIVVKDKEGYRFVNLVESLTLFVERVDL